MAYDIFCYEPSSGVPNIEEAKLALSRDEEHFQGKVDTSKRQNPEKKLKIAAALMDHTPSLRPFKFDFKKIAEFQKISEDEARLRWNHIELNSPEGELAFQFTISDNSVQIAIPYWYRGREADEVFSRLSEYLRIIRKVAGYFVYDPQTKLAFDPLKTDLDSRELYDMTMKEIPGMIKDLQEGKGPPRKGPGS